MRIALERFFLAIALPALAACAQSPDCFSAKVFCAALATDTLGLNDHGINQDTWAGLEQAKANGLADEIAYIESVDARDYEKNIAYFAHQGFDVIVTAGIGMRDETLRASDLYPDSVFIGMNQPQEEARPNLIPIAFAEDQMGFLAGALSARLTKTRVVGAVCETSGIDSMWRYCEGFRAGVKSVDDGIKILVVYRDDGDREKLFIDEAWGAETAQGLIRRGVDVLFAAGGATGQGALRAASEAGVYGIGAERDQAKALGKSNLRMATSIYGLAGFEVQETMRRLKNGNVGQPVLGQFGYLPLNENFPENLPPELNALLAGLLSGELKTTIPLKKP